MQKNQKFNSGLNDDAYTKSVLIPNVLESGTFTATTLTGSLDY